MPDKPTTEVRARSSIIVAYPTDSDYVSHDDTVERFQAEWVEIVNKLKGKLP